MTKFNLFGVLFFISLLCLPFVGRADTEILRPNATGTETSIGNTSGGKYNSHWDKVNKVAVDDTTSVIAFSGGGSVWQRDLYALTDHSGNGIINSVMVTARMGVLAGNGLFGEISLSTHNTTYDSSAYTLTNNVFNNFTNTWVTNPNTGQAWTWAEIDALQAGVNLYYFAGFSLLPGQLVSMADGSQKKIEEIKKDDKVLAYNFQTKRVEPDSVTEIFRGHHDDYLVLNDVLAVSTNHVIYVNGQFKPAEEAKIGDWLTDEQGRKVVITSLKHIWRPTDTYDIEIGHNHNFFASGYLVHNPIAPPGGGMITSATQLYVTVDYTLPDITAPTPGTVSFSDVGAGSLTVTAAGAADNVALAAAPYEYHNLTLDSYSGPSASAWTPSDLNPGTNYSFEIGVKDSSGNWATTSPAATTTLAKPTVLTQLVSVLGPNRASLKGVVSDIGGNTPSAQGFAYSPSLDFVNSAATTTDGLDIAVSNLACGTSYYYRAYATNAAGTGYGSTESFKTDKCPPPPGAQSLSFTYGQRVGYPLMTTSPSVSVAVPAVSSPPSSAPASVTPHLLTQLISLKKQVLNVSLSQPSPLSLAKNLQQALNTLGYPVAKTGPGSPGQETNTFGPLTRAALVKFQVAQQIIPSSSSLEAGYFGPKTKGKLRELLK